MNVSIIHELVDPINFVSTMKDLIRAWNVIVLVKAVMVMDQTCVRSVLRDIHLKMANVKVSNVKI